MIRILLSFLLFVSTTLNALDSAEKIEVSTDDLLKIELANEQIDAIKNSITTNIWLIGYQNYITYQGLFEELMIVDRSVKNLSRKRDKKSKAKLADSLKEQEELLKQIYKIQPFSNTEERILIVSQDILALNSAHDLAETAFSVHSKKVDRVVVEVTNDIIDQIKKAFDIGIFVLIVILISFGFKFISKKYSKGYTDIARRGLNKLRSQYSLKNTNVEPRIYSFLEPHGLTISTWYMTNSYAALTLRSTISADIVDAINKENDIKIAYPTQTIDARHTSKRMPPDIDINKGVLY